ncbi:MAG: L,D-transpeptidase family protein [Pseudomonadota bacterium]
MRYFHRFIFLVFIAQVGFSFVFSFSAMSVAPQATKILIKKKDRQLCLMRGEKILKTYKIALGFNPKGHKTQEGDGKTPEGTYKGNYSAYTGRQAWLADFAQLGFCQA